MVQYSLITKGEKALNGLSAARYMGILHLLFLKANVVAWYGTKDGTIINSSENE